MPTLAVVMPNYNHAKYLDRAIRAILDQSRTPDEFLIADDCSTDDSVRIIGKYLENSQVRLFQNEENLGTVPNLNRLVDLVTSDYVYFASADDLVLPGFFSRAMKLLSQYQDAGLCCTHPAHIRSGSETIEWLDNWYRCGEQEIFLSQEEARKQIGPDRFGVPGHTSIVKTDLVRKYGGFDPGLKWHADWFLLHVIALRHGFCYVPDPLAAWRVSPDTYSTKGRNNPYQQAKVLMRMVDLLKRQENEDIRNIFLELDIFAYFPEYYPELLKELDTVSGWVDSRRVREKVETLERRIEELDRNLRAYNNAKKVLSFLKPLYRSLFRHSTGNRPE